MGNKNEAPGREIDLHSIPAGLGSKGFPKIEVEFFLYSVPAHRRKRNERRNPSPLSSSRPLRLLMNIEMNLLLPLSQLAPLLGAT